MIADETYRSLVRYAVPEVAFLPEPAARNTAAAIALAAARIDRPERVMRHTVGGLLDPVTAAV